MWMLILSCSFLIYLGLQLSILLANGCVQQDQVKLDAGTPPGLIKIFTGSAPTNTTDADSGTRLCTLTLSSTSAGAASGGVLTFSAITSDTNAAATGTAGYGRTYNAAGTCIHQFSVGTSGADVNFNSLSIVIGGTVAISSLTITQPQGP